MSDFLKRVGMAQAELKAPKNQYNSFGKYNYRSCEDILEAAKPINQMCLIERSKQPVITTITIREG